MFASSNALDSCWIIDFWQATINPQLKIIALVHQKEAELADEVGHCVAESIVVANWVRCAMVFHVVSLLEKCFL